MLTDGDDELSRRSANNLKFSGSSCRAFGTSEVVRLFTWCTAIVAAAATLAQESPRSSPASPRRRTRTPMLAFCRSRPRQLSGTVHKIASTRSSKD
eukprot:286799-Rhodomonas_salina.1